MKELVIFTIPKPFVEPHIKMIQENAIQSWLRLAPRPRVILCCDDEGIAAAAKKFDCAHFLNVERYESVPLVSHVFDIVQRTNPNAMMLYVNADIILFQDVVLAIERATERFEQFMLIGQRWNWADPKPIEFDALSDAHWWYEGEQMIAHASGWMDPPVCTDYFAFPSGAVQDMPPFIVGYYAWDSWLVSYHNHRTSVPVIDASSVVNAIHQDHRRHRHPRNHPLSLRNIAMLPDDEIRTTGRTDMVSWVMTADEIKRR